MNLSTQIILRNFNVISVQTIIAVVHRLSSLIEWHYGCTAELLRQENISVFNVDTTVEVKSLHTIRLKSLKLIYIPPILCYKQ